jgi:hypothetical protein
MTVAHLTAILYLFLATKNNTNYCSVLVMQFGETWTPLLETRSER